MALSMPDKPGAELELGLDLENPGLVAAIGEMFHQQPIVTVTALSLPCREAPSHRIEQNIQCLFHPVPPSGIWPA